MLLRKSISCVFESLTPNQAKRETQLKLYQMIFVFRVMITLTWWTWRLYSSELFTCKWKYD